MVMWTSVEVNVAMHPSRQSWAMESSEVLSAESEKICATNGH